MKNILRSTIPVEALSIVFLAIVLIGCEPDTGSSPSWEVSDPPQLEEALPDQPTSRQDLLPLPEIISWVNHEGATLTLEDGTEVEVPPRAVIDVEGNRVIGRVSLEYLALKNPVEAIAANVSLGLDSAGKSYWFRSAGIFQLQAEKNGEPLYLAPNAALTLRMPGVEPGSYELFTLNERTRRWQFLRNYRVEAPPAPRAVELPQLPLKPEAIQPGDLVLNYQPQYQQFAELRDYPQLQWGYVNDPAYPNLASNPALLRRPYRNSRLVKRLGENTYLLRLEGSGTEPLDLRVQPVMEPLAYEEAIRYYEDQLAKRRELARTAERNAATRLAELRCELPQFGIYQIDASRRSTAASKLKASFFVEGEAIELEYVWLVVPNWNTAVRYEKNHWGSLSIPENEPVFLVAWMPDQRVAILRPDAVQRALAASPVVFRLEVYPEPIVNPNQLKDLLRG